MEQLNDTWNFENDLKQKNEGRLAAKAFAWLRFVFNVIFCSETANGLNE